jgi:Predicted membrane protein (DUF2238)
LFAGNSFKRGEAPASGFRRADQPAPCLSSAPGEAAEAFLGTRGDVWDMQWDMQMAVIGAVTALAALARIHDRQLARISAQG